MTTFTIDKVEMEFEGLPQKSKDALLSRVAGHFNNESASAAIGWAKQQIAGKDGKAVDVTTEAARLYREQNPDATTAFVKGWYETKRGQILEGTLGVRSAGGSSDPLEDAMFRIAKNEMRIIMGKALPKGTGDKATTYVALDGTSYVGAEGHDQLAELWLGMNDAKGRFGKVDEPNGPRIERLAKRELAARAEAAKKQMVEKEF